MNDYDKAGRYLIKCDPAGFWRWLLNNPALAFHLWIDARRLALPDQHDLTNDLVAALRVAGGLEALCLELQAEARPDTITRVLGYLSRLLSEPSEGGALSLLSAGGVVLNLTGRGEDNALTVRPTIAPECRLDL